MRKVTLTGGDDVGSLRKVDFGQLLVFSVTPFKIDQNKIQNHSTDKVHGK